MKGSIAASRYARALFELAQKRDSLVQTDHDLTALSEIYRTNPVIERLLFNSAISIQDKEAFLTRRGGAHLSPRVMSFLKVLLQKRRCRELLSVQAEFHRLMEKSQGIQEVTVLSAVPLNAPNRDSLGKMLEKKLKSKVRLVTKTDPSLLGGLIVRFDGRQINGSYRDRPRALKQSFLAS